MRYVSEKYQSGMLAEYLEGENIEFAKEVNIYSIPVDIVGRDGDDLLMIEMKTKDFARGIAQAERNLAYADYSYLAVWEFNVTENLIARIDSLKIGLLGVDSGVVVHSSAKRNDPNPYAKENAISKVTDEL